MDLQLETIYAVVSVYAIKITIAIAIFVVGKFIAKRVVKVAQTVMRKSHVDETLVGFAGNILFGLALGFVVIAALSQLGINTTSLAAVVAAAGLAIGLALQGSLSNLAAGVMIILFRPFRVGDFVEVAGVGGTVEGISIFTTQLRSPDNKSIVIPNGTIIGDNIINFSAKPTRRVDMMFGVGYGDDLKKVKEIMYKIVNADERVLSEPAPTIAVMELGDNSVNLVCRPWVASAEYWNVYFDIMENMKIAFDEAGISIPFPQRDLHIVSNDAGLCEAKKPSDKTDKKAA